MSFQNQTLVASTMTASITTPTIKRVEEIIKVHSTIELEVKIVEYRVLVGNPMSSIAFLLLRAKMDGHTV
jgi:hypothetical protein